MNIALVLCLTLPIVSYILLGVMSKHRIVIDTNVLVSAIYSSRSFSFKLISLIGSDLFETALSVPLFVEHDDVTHRFLSKTNLTEDALNDILNYIALIAFKQEIYYLWRPFLKDPKDDMVLELAVASQSGVIITFNTKDFTGVHNQFGIDILTPFEFLEQIGALK